MEHLELARGQAVLACQRPAALVERGLRRLGHRRLDRRHAVDDLAEAEPPQPDKRIADEQQDQRRGEQIEQRRAHAGQRIRAHAQRRTQRRPQARNAAAPRERCHRAAAVARRHRDKHRPCNHVEQHVARGQQQHRCGARARQVHGHGQEARHDEQHRHLHEQIGGETLLGQQRPNGHYRHGQDREERRQRHAADLAEAQRAAERHTEQEQAHEQLAGQRQERRRARDREIVRSLAGLRLLEHGASIAPRQGPCGEGSRQEDRHTRPHGQQPGERRRRSLHHERQRDQHARLGRGQPRRRDARGQNAPGTANRQRARRQHQQRRASQPQRQRKGAACRHKDKGTRIQRPHMQKRRPERCKQTDCYKDGRVDRDRYVASICEHPVEEREHRHVHERRDRKHQRQRGERAPKRRRKQAPRVGAAGFGMQLLIGHARILSWRYSESAVHPKVRGASYANFPAGATPGRLPPTCRRDGLRPWCGRRPGP